jgi:hypothetical protein
MPSTPWLIGPTSLKEAGSGFSVQRFRLRQNFGGQARFTVAVTLPKAHGFQSGGLDNR